MSSKDNDDERVLHSKGNKIEIKINDEVGENKEEPFQLLLSRYQIWLETSIKGSDLVFDCVNLLYCKCHKISFKTKMIINSFNTM